MFQFFQKIFKKYLASPFGRGGARQRDGEGGVHKTKRREQAPALRCINNIRTNRVVGDDALRKYAGGIFLAKVGSNL